MPAAAARSRSRGGAPAAAGTGWAPPQREGPHWLPQGQRATGLLGVAIGGLLMLWLGGSTTVRTPPPPALPLQPPRDGREGAAAGGAVGGLFRHALPEVDKPAMKGDTASLLQERERLLKRLSVIASELGSAGGPPATPAQAPAPAQPTAERAGSADPAPAGAEEPRCLAWRQTGGCNPNGPRESNRDQPCDATIAGSASGYCECSGGRHRAQSGCGHQPLRCDQVCAAPPPAAPKQPPATPQPPTTPSPAPVGAVQFPPPASPWRGSAAQLIALAGLPPPDAPRPRAPDKEALFTDVSDTTQDPAPAPDEALQGDWDARNAKARGGSTAARRAAVIEGLLHSWRSYRSRAWGRDELRPVSGVVHEWAQGSVGLTMIEALPTLWLAGLHEEFHRGREWVRDQMQVRPRGGVSPFEFTIRLVGGLLSAYEVSGERYREFVTRAQDITSRLLLAFEEDGLPSALVDLSSGGRTRYWGWAHGANLVTSEFTSLQLEFRTLSLHTGDPSYDMRATWAEDMAVSALPADGLGHAFFRRGEGFLHRSRISITAHGDSFYEYLMKQYVLTGGTEERYLELWERSAKSILEHVVVRYPHAGITTVNEGFREGGGIRAGRDMDHLACFSGAMYALGALHSGSSPHRAIYTEAARNLTHACRALYKAMPAGIAPEISTVLDHGADGVSILSKVHHYNLRPEYAESLFYMWRITKDPIYRDWGWDMFATLQKYSRTPHGYSGFKDVRSAPPAKDDWMPGFFFSETLKYLLLLFSDDSLVPLDRWVFNTEGHPLKIRKRDPLELWPEQARSARAKQSQLGVRELSGLYRRGDSWLQRSGFGTQDNPRLRGSKRQPGLLR
eukprot:TRINITY_DN24741_c0_g1_i1.p1 TRINITY_DN24741_c0_g1~~TRINITY_DN24741_c0_g1_i1.p1  ORF type:complete len:847 (+),score=184.29 TRINITY_DN24741_c0_g1_i1:90-2630(+)